MQNAINFLYRQLDRLGELITASAYSQARRKIRPELFTYLRQEMLTVFYRSDEPDEEPIVRWCGRRLVGGDITMINLPDVKRLRQQYTVQTNKPSDTGVVQAAGLVCFDVLNDVALSAHLLKRASAKQMLIEHAIADLDPTDVLLLDREFGDSGLIAYLCDKKQDFIIRVQSVTFLKDVTAFVASGALDAIVEVPVALKQREFAREHQLAATVSVRLIRYDLPSGDVEVLLTSLIDRSLYSRTDIITAYGLRWNIETYFDRLKNFFELERFSSKTPQAIEQDFQGIIFLSTLESILTRPANTALDQQSKERKHKFPQKVNRSVSYAVLLDTVIELLCDTSKTTAQVLEEITLLLMTSPTSIRPNRSYPRTLMPKSQRHRYLRYTKRLT